MKYSSISSKFSTQETEQNTNKNRTNVKCRKYRFQDFSKSIPPYFNIDDHSRTDFFLSKVLIKFHEIWTYATVNGESNINRAFLFNAPY